MFKLSLKSGGKKISYKNLSVSVRYFIDEKKLKESVKNFERVSKTKLSDLQRKNFLSSESTEIRVSRANGKPDDILLVKVKLDEKFTNDFFRNHLAGFLPTLGKEEVKSLHIFIPNHVHLKKYFDELLHLNNIIAHSESLLSLLLANKIDVRKLEEIDREIHAYRKERCDLNSK